MVWKIPILKKTKVNKQEKIRIKGEKYHTISTFRK
jgi:hypothetical protein